MKTGQHPVLFLFAALLMLAAGICLGLLWGETIPLAWGGFAILLVLALVLLWRKSPLCALTVLLLFLVLGIIRLQAMLALPPTDIAAFAGAEIKVSGTIVDEPLWTPSVLPDGSRIYKVRYLVAVEQVKEPRAAWQKASGKCYLYARAKALPEQPARIGDAVQASGKVRLPRGYQNPGQLDTNLLLRADGITAGVVAGKSGVKIEPRDGHEFRRFIAAVRAHYREGMEHAMPKEDAAAVFAMLFGGYEGLEEELVTDFQATGIVHILSVSGSHISLIAAVMAWLAALLRLPRAISAAFVLSCIAFYSILAGCVPPVIRSAIMGGLTFLALALGRERESRYILLLTGLLMLLWNPLLLFHISFELSYLATAGLIFLASVFRAWLRARSLPDAIAMNLAITLSAQLATLPVLAWYFGQVSLSSLLANLLVVPILELIIIFGLFAGLLAFLLPFFGHIIFAMTSLMLGLAAELVHMLARLPGGIVYVAAMAWPTAALYYLALGTLLLGEEQREWLRTRLTPWRRPAFALFLVLAASIPLYRAVTPDCLAVHFIDVGQGDAALVVTPQGRALLFDTGGTREGGFDVGARVAVPYLLHHGIREVAAVFLTHAHEDHAQGCGSILQKLPVGAVYTAGEGTAAYARSMGLSDASPLLQKFHAAREGETMTVDGVKVEVLFAPPAPEEGGTGNEVSNVYRVSYGRAQFLFTGDLVKEQEAKLVASGRDIRASVLKVGHHGSATSSSPAFLEAVGPRYGVFCVGFENAFGHPKPEVLRRYEEQGIGILRTDREGAIVFETDGEKLWLHTYAGS